MPDQVLLAFLFRWVKVVTGKTRWKRRGACWRGRRRRISWRRRRGISCKREGELWKEDARDSVREVALVILMRRRMARKASIFQVGTVTMLDLILLMILMLLVALVVTNRDLMVVGDGWLLSLALQLLSPLMELVTGE